MRYIGEREAEERYIRFLNETEPAVDICGWTYSPAQALKAVDEIAYRQGFYDWLDFENLTTDEAEADE